MRQERQALKLRAEDADDLQVISGVLQDAIVPVGDMLFDAANRRFVMVANRFRWEGEGAGRAAAERVNCGVSFAHVTRVERRGLADAGRGGFLSLLAITADAGSEGPGTTILLTFSGDAAIRLESEGLLCHLEDFGEPWPTQWQPRHGD